MNLTATVQVVQPLQLYLLMPNVLLYLDPPSGIFLSIIIAIPKPL